MKFEDIPEGGFVHEGTVYRLKRATCNLPGVGIRSRLEVAVDAAAQRYLVKWCIGTSLEIVGSIEETPAIELPVEDNVNKDSDDIASILDAVAVEKVSTDAPDESIPPPPVEIIPPPAPGNEDTIIDTTSKVVTDGKKEIPPPPPDLKAEKSVPEKKGGPVKKK